MPVIIIQSESPASLEGQKYPLQVATDGYLMADPDNDTQIPLIIASDGYIADE
jgi:hypothetical protein